MTFNGCDYWKPATGITWEDLPSYHFVGFYEGDACWGGGYQFISKRTVGRLKFHKDNKPITQPLRSLMIGKTVGTRPQLIYRGCFNEDPPVVEATLVDVTDNNSDSKGDEFLVVNDSLSSNWTDLLRGVPT
ncbi:hypothetical protein PHMEG_00011764 [Phytophthora megakarya]|uniref:Uncharacterized protein n=1 Tax=Phytophthora megakarya TaxID=4795 RepID=A0A225WC55_9STRA|nr:hypothetical protein PHMEG_00011764 [Phytophthora megakarya]